MFEKKTKKKAVQRKEKDLDKLTDNALVKELAKFEKGNPARNALAHEYNKRKSETGGAKAPIRDLLKNAKSKLK